MTVSKTASHFFDPLQPFLRGSRRATGPIFRDRLLLQLATSMRNTRGMVDRMDSVDPNLSCRLTFVSKPEKTFRSMVFSIFFDMNHLLPRLRRWECRERSVGVTKPNEDLQMPSAKRRTAVFRRKPATRKFERQVLSRRENRYRCDL